MDKSTSSDALKLERYHATGDEQAFAELCEAYAGMVYGVACRCLGDTDRANDVTQAVFLTLARKAKRVARVPCLAAWLHRTTVLESNNARRLEARRQRVMKTYEQMCDDEERNASQEPELLALLDEALNQLQAKDRHLLIWRFFEGRSHREIAQQLGRQEDAARKQVKKALERLAQMMHRRGIATSCVALGTLLTSELAKAAPTGLVKGLVTQTASSGGRALVATTLLGIPVKLTLVSLVAFAVAVPVGMTWQGRTGKPALERPRSTALSILSTRQRSSLVTSTQAVDLVALQRALESLTEDHSTTELLAIQEALLLLSRDSLPEVLEIVKSLPKLNAQAFYRPVVATLYSRWAELDMAGALAAVDSLGELPSHGYHLWVPDHALRTVLSVWVEVDFEAALAWAQSSELSWDVLELYESLARRRLPEVVSHLETIEGSPDYEAVAKMVFQRWAREDVDEALAWVRELSDERLRQSLIENGVRSLSWNSQAAAFEIAQRFSDKPWYASAIGGLLSSWAREDPVAAAASFDKLPKTVKLEDDTLVNIASAMVDSSLAIGLEFKDTLPPSAADRVLRHACWTLAKQDPQSAASLLGGVVQQDRHWQELHKETAHAWGAEDPLRVARWIDALEDGGARDQAIDGLAMRLVITDPRQALGWADRIQHDGLKQDLTERLAKRWLEQDSASAKRWLAEESSIKEQRWTRWMEAR